MHRESHVQFSFHPSTEVSNLSGNKDIHHITIKFDDALLDASEIQRYWSEGWDVFQNALLTLQPVPILRLTIAQNQSLVKSLIDGDFLKEMVQGDHLVLCKEDPGPSVTVREVVAWVEDHASDDTSAEKPTPFKAFESLMEAKQSEKVHLRNPAMTPTIKEASQTF